MVGVPAFAMWLCGPSGRMVCPIWRAVSRRITHGPRRNETIEAGQRGHERPERLVSKDVEHRVRDVQRVEKMIEHHGDVPAPSSSRTTSSIRMP